MIITGRLSKNGKGVRDNWLEVKGQVNVMYK